MTDLKKLNKPDGHQYVGLRNKLFLQFGGVGSLVVLALLWFKLFGVPFLGIAGTYQTRIALTENSLQLIADYKKKLLENWLFERQAELRSMSTHRGVLRRLYVENSVDIGKKYLKQHLDDLVRNSPAMSSLWFVDLASQQVLAAAAQEPYLWQKQQEFIRQVQQSANGFATGIVHDKNHHDCAVMFGQLVYLDMTKKPVAVLLGKTDEKTFITPLLHNVRGLGESGEVVLVDQGALLLSPLKYSAANESTATAFESIMTGTAAQNAARGIEGIFAGLDYRKQPSIAASRAVDLGGGYRWGLVVKQARSEILGPVYQEVGLTALGGLAGIVILLALVYFLIRRFVLPIESLSRVADSVRLGDFSARAPTGSGDEIANLAIVFNAMVEQISRWQDELKQVVKAQTLELQEAYQSLQRKERHQASIGEISQSYLEKGHLEESLGLLMERAIRFSGANSGRFFRCTLENGVVTITHVSEEQWAGDTNESQEEGAKRAFSAQECTLANDPGVLFSLAVKNNLTMTFDAEQLRQMVLSPLPEGNLGIESLLICPVTIAGKVFGAIGLVNRPSDFGPEEIAGVEAFAAEAALLIYADEREVALAAAEETVRLRSEFMANMSHELRTPLNVIIGMNQLLQEMDNPKIQQDFLTKIGFSAKQLLALINDVLDLSKVSAGEELALERSVFDPEELFFSVTQLLSFRQDDRRVEMHVDISRDIPTRLIGDAHRLTQIVNNLLSNAVKFTAEGSVVLRIVPVAIQGRQITLAISVTDTGIGMSPKQQEKVFLPFVQLDGSKTRQHGGSGLGLAISQKLAQLMGGDIRLESTPGVGSTFRLELPFEIDPDAEPSRRHLVPDNALHGLSVLVVNGCTHCRSILRPMLEAMTFKVQMVSSAAEALTWLQQAVDLKTPYRVVLVAPHLEDMQGVELVERLVELNPPATRTILLSNPADLAALSERADRLSLAGLLSTPVRPSDLFDAILNACGEDVETRAQALDLSVRWQQVKLLLVDDNDLGRLMIRTMLENVGVEVVEAVNGADALDKVKADDFDLVLMDIQMPVMDGLAAAKAIRKLDKPGIDTLPILALTAHAFAEHREESLSSGMNGHVTKPVEMEHLYTELNRWLPATKQQLLNIQPRPATLQIADLEKALPGVAVAAGVRRAVGGRTAYLSLLGKFVQQFSATAPELRAELDAGEYQDALRRVHTLKGVAGSLGAEKLQQLAGQLEVQLGEQPQSANIDAMLEEHESFLTLLTTLPELPGKDQDEERSAGTKAELLELLRQLLDPLQHLRAQEVRPLVARLKERDWPVEFSATLTQLTDTIERYQFKPAAEWVAEMLRDNEA